jgi:hypothetical protein
MKLPHGRLRSLLYGNGVKHFLSAEQNYPLTLFLRQIGQCSCRVGYCHGAIAIMRQANGAIEMS